ncbi:MAG: PDZ domain-containing protein [Ferruginibacter sp.]
MNKIFLAATALCFMSFSNIVFAQDEQDNPPKDKQREEIIIRNNDDKQMNLTVQINGDSILVNGKPLDVFIDSNVTINKRKMVIHDSGNEMNFDLSQQGDVFRGFGKHWKNKEAIKPFLGVTTEKTANGVKVVATIDSSAAAKAGLKEGDIIIKIDNKIIDDPQTLLDVVTSYKPKDKITVTYIRNGKSKTTKATLGERKEERAFAYSFNGHDMDRILHNMPPMPPMNDNGDNMPEYNYDVPQFGNPDFDMPHPKKLGLKIQDTEDGNVKIIDVDDSSNAAKAGLQTGDIITEIDGEKIHNTDDAREQLHPEEGKKIIHDKSKP